MATTVTNGLNLASQRIINLGTPTADADAVTKSYVDSVARGLDWKASARVASTGNLTLAAPGATIDGVTMASGDRVLLKDQTAPAENGLYSWVGASSTLTRTTDADSNAEVTSGLAVSITEGTVSNDRVYILTTPDPIVLGTTSLLFSQLGGGGGTYVAGNGLDETPAGTFNVGAGTGIVVAADTVAIDPNIVMRRLAANIGDGVLTSITVTHNFGTRDVQVEVYSTSSPWDSQICDVTRPNVNDVTLGFATAPATGAIRVVVIG